MVKTAFRESGFNEFLTPFAVGLINAPRAVLSQFQCARTRFWTTGLVYRWLDRHHAAFGSIHGPRVRGRPAFSRPRLWPN